MGVKLKNLTKYAITLQMYIPEIITDLAKSKITASWKPEETIDVNAWYNDSGFNDKLITEYVKRNILCKIGQADNLLPEPVDPATLLIYEDELQIPLLFDHYLDSLDITFTAPTVFASYTDQVTVPGVFSHFGDVVQLISIPSNGTLHYTDEFVSLDIEFVDSPTSLLVADSVFIDTQSAEFTGDNLTFIDIASIDTSSTTGITFIDVVSMDYN